ncbi:unnamed protein product [Euphydryas editha]|uniref:Transposable element P transposase n=1 Tax=Euphydryas editha TaxID=104508 RepID=A0AAU9TVM3_EUPED|nr:unnamed protein product [Euphydryas editha]
MSITPEIHYDASQDELKGFANNDPKNFADHVLVFMIKGIKANYKQPVAYYFTNGLKKDELKHIIYDVIKNIQATGLHVLCTVCDQATVNGKCKKEFPSPFALARSYKNVKNSKISKRKKICERDKTLEGIQNVWKILYQKYSFDTLLTRNLNQDPIEIFFGNIRSYGVRNVAPNTITFEGAYKSLLLNNYNAPHSIRSNCEEDKNKCLQTIDFFLTEKPSSDIPEDKNDNFTFNLETLHSKTKEDKGQSNYVCGWVVAKCFKKITKLCKICRSNLNEKCEVEGNALIRAKEFNKNKKWLCYPNKNVIEVFQEIQRITCSFLKKDVPKYIRVPYIKQI